MAYGRPTEYNEEVLEATKAYINSSTDTIDETGKAIKVKLPTLEGLALHLDIHKDTVQDWKQYPDFSVLLSRLLAKQAQALINMGLQGSYNPTIAKVLLTKHGYREGTDITTNDKDLPMPLLSALEKKNQPLPEEK